MVDPVGEYDVVFRVADSAKTTQATFKVRVTKANFAVVTSDLPSTTNDPEKRCPRGSFAIWSLASANLMSACRIASTAKSGRPTSYS